MKKKIYFIYFLIFLKGLNAFEGKEYREKEANTKKIDYILQLDERNMNVLIKELSDLKNKNKYQKRMVMVLYLLRYAREVQRINKKDGEVILKFIGKTNIDKENYVDSELIESLFVKKNNKFLKNMFKVEKFLKKHNKSGMITYQTYNYLGPFIEFYKTICEFGKNYDDKKIFARLKKEKKCKIKKKLFKNLKVKDLLDKIKNADRQIIKDYHVITPFVAKIILQELLYSELNVKDKKEFYKRIVNKTDYSEFTCGKFCNKISPLIGHDDDKVIFHTGYQLLNSIKGADRLESYFKYKNTEPLKNPQSVGIECSLFIQRAIERTNIGRIKGRMKTTYMYSALVKSGIAREIILNKEEQLIFGDIVKLKGHTFVFLGYKKFNNRYYAVTLEAVGGNLRSVGVFYRKFYSKEQGGFNYKVLDNGKTVKSSRDEYYYIYRIK